MILKPPPEHAPWTRGRVPRPLNTIQKVFVLFTDNIRLRVCSEPWTWGYEPVHLFVNTVVWKILSRSCKTYEKGHEKEMNILCFFMFWKYEEAFCYSCYFCVKMTLVWVQTKSAHQPLAPQKWGSIWWNMETAWKTSRFKWRTVTF